MWEGEREWNTRRRRYKTVRRDTDREIIHKIKAKMEKTKRDEKRKEANGKPRYMRNKIDRDERWKWKDRDVKE